MKAAIYCRVSTEEQDETLQLKDIATIYQGDSEIFKDKQSGWNENKDRADFERLKKAIQQKQITDLYVWDWDRLFRKRTRLKEFFEFCNIFKCNVHSYRQQFMESVYAIPAPFNDIIKSIFIDILGWLAEEESNKKSERVKMAVRKKDGITTSYKGNKWGRKKISTFKLNLIKKELLKIPKPSMRQIAREVGLSVGVVHKYTQQIQDEKTQQEVCVHLEVN